MTEATKRAARIEPPAVEPGAIEVVAGDLAAVITRNAAGRAERLWIGSAGGERWGDAGELLATIGELVLAARYNRDARGLALWEPAPERTDIRAAWLDYDRIVEAATLRGGQAVRVHVAIEWIAGAWVGLGFGVAVTGELKSGACAEANALGEALAPIARRLSAELRGRGA